jgi:hypothetical protein
MCPGAAAFSVQALNGKSQETNLEESTTLSKSPAQGF